VARSIRTGAADRARFPDEVLEVFRRSAAEPGALGAMLAYYRAGPASLRVQRARGFPRIDVPTLLLWGERDRALGKELSYGTGQYASELTVRYLPEVGHFVQQEAPETVNAMLEAWLRERPVPQAAGAAQAGSPRR
jgi:pimeloyl-ACP methyl ester carboxylesterase